MFDFVPPERAGISSEYVLKFINTHRNFFLYESGEIPATTLNIRPKCVLLLYPTISAISEIVKSVSRSNFCACLIRTAFKYSMNANPVIRLKVRER